MSCLTQRNAIAVICPFHRNEETIIRAAKSIFSQSFLPKEVIFVDDNSPDRSLDLLRAYLSNLSSKVSVQVISIKHSGPGHARNIGIAKSSAEWISFLDADDYWLPNKLQNTIQIIHANKNINFISHEEYVVNNLIIKNSKLSRYFNPSITISKQLYKRNFLSTSTCTVLKSFIENYLFDPNLTSGQDYELWLALSPRIKLEFIKKPLGFYDVSSPNSITNSSQFKRYRNLLIILFRYAKYVNFFLFGKILIKHSLAFIAHIFKK